MVNNQDEALRLWLDEGVKSGFCSPVVCIHHAPLPLSDLEQDLDDDDLIEACAYVVRLWWP